MPAPSPTYHLANHLLRGRLEHFVRTRRSDGRSWRLIARDLYEKTTGVIDVTHETLRSWFPDDENGEAA